MDYNPLNYQNSQVPKNNGGVDISDNSNSKTYPLYQSHKQNSEYKDEALKGIQTSSPLSQLFSLVKM